MMLQRLGKSDLKITPIGIGAWAIGGGKWEFGWGPQNDKDSIAAIHAGLVQGLNWIDTAAAYGLGHSETIAGRAIKNLHAPPYVFTKCSLVWGKDGKISHNLQAASIRREAEASLKRLRVNRIDLYQIHWPAWKGQPGDASPGSIEEAMLALMVLQRLVAAPVLAGGARGRNVHPAVRFAESDRRHCLLPDVFRITERGHD